MNRRFLLLSLVPIALAILVSTLAVGTVFHFILATPTYTYSAPVYTTTAPHAVCAGETVFWQPTLTVVASDAAPVVPALLRTLYRVSPPSTKVFDETPSYAIYFESVTLSPKLSFVVPLETAPGSYEVRVARIEEGFRSTGYRVPFLVRVCDSGGEAGR